MSDLMKVGADWGDAGSFKPRTAGISGGLRIIDAHARFFDSTIAGRRYMTGASITSINAVTFTSATTGATATPIIGIWNPLNSQKYCIIEQAQLAVVMTALAATGPGGFVWMTSVGNAGITTGLVPTNAGTFLAGGSVAKGFAGAALTGMTGTLVVLRGSGFGGGSAENVAFTATAAGMQTQQVTQVENIDGSIVVFPGGVLALMATTTPVAHSVVAGLTWEEVPFLVTV
jgi:hypothetical protein